MDFPGYAADPLVWILWNNNTKKKKKKEIHNICIVFKKTSIGQLPVFPIHGLIIQDAELIGWLLSNEQRGYWHHLLCAELQFFIHEGRKQWHSVISLFFHRVHARWKLSMHNPIGKNILTNKNKKAQSSCVLSEYCTTPMYLAIAIVWLQITTPKIDVTRQGLHTYDNPYKSISPDKLYIQYIYKVQDSDPIHLFFLMLQSDTIVWIHFFSHD